MGAGQHSKADWTGSSYVIREPKHAPGGIAAIIGGLGIEEEQANARLFLAAPELLKLLDECLPVLQAAQRHALRDRVSAAIAEVKDGRL